MVGNYVAAFALSIVAITTSGCNGKNDVTAKPTAIATVPSIPVVGIGTLAIVDSSANGLACIRDRGDFEAATRANDDRSHVEGSRSIALAAGTRVRILDGVASKDGTQIRLEEGDSAGAACWVRKDRARKFSGVAATP